MTIYQLLELQRNALLAVGRLDSLSRDKTQTTLVQALIEDAKSNVNDILLELDRLISKKVK